MYIHVQTPQAVPTEEAIRRTFAFFECEPLGGKSADGWSGISALQRCAYRYYLERELDAVPLGRVEGLERPPLAIGSIVHTCIALHYMRMLPEGYPGWRAKAPSPDEFLDKLLELGAEAAYVVEARRLIWGYMEYWGVEEIQPVAIEYEAGIPGIHTCRYDMVAWERDQLWIYEHKSAARAQRSTTEGWWLDGEIIGEVYGWELSHLSSVFGAPLAGVKMNMLFKERSNPQPYQRIDIVVPQNVLQQYQHDRRYWAEQRERFRRTGYWPRSLNGCQSRYSDLCEFWDHCRDPEADLIKIRRPVNTSPTPNVSPGK